MRKEVIYTFLSIFICLILLTLYPAITIRNDIVNAKKRFTQASSFCDGVPFFVERFNLVSVKTTLGTMYLGEDTFVGEANGWYGRATLVSVNPNKAEFLVWYPEKGDSKCIVTKENLLDTESASPVERIRAEKCSSVEPCD
jgi:hypothetical protein